MAEVDAIEVKLDELKDYLVAALVNQGHESGDAIVIADTLMYAELRSNNQGVIKLVTGALGADPLASAIEVQHDTLVSCRMNGGMRSGMVCMSQAVDIAIAKAAVSGISIVGVSKYCSATGALGAWTYKMAQAGYIGIVMSQCSEMVAPHGSYEPIFGTNPMSIGIPMTPRCQVLDMATSAYAWFGLVTADKEGLPIPGDVAVDNTGQSTTDPAKAMAGALRSFDRSYKGSHLGLMVELLAGALTGAAMTDKKKERDWGSLVLCISPNIFGDELGFQQRAEEMCNRVKAAKLLPGMKELYLPGERGDAVAQANLEKGTLSMSTTVLEDLLRIAAPKGETESDKP